MATIIPLLAQFGADAGAAAIWWNKDVSSNQWLLSAKPPITVTRTDHEITP